MKKVVAFGTGKYYWEREEEIKKNYDIVAFFDNDSEKWGTKFDGKEIISPEELERYQNMDILITSTYKYEIITQLFEKGVDEKKIHCIFPMWMSSYGSAMVCQENGGGVKLNMNGISAVLHNKIEEMICYEIWNLEEYNLNLPEDSIVIDIGLNVGLATLFFANKKNVKKVYAFEPDKRVYDKAIYNIEINDHIKSKIKTYNVACANEDRTETYMIDNRESAGVFKMSNVLNVSSGKIDVTCVDAAKVLGEIIDRHYGDKKIVMKCDCEGAEYEIFYRLEETGYFDKIDAFVMEWHDNRKKELEGFFERNHYTYMISNEQRKVFGLCYAVKS